MTQSTGNPRASTLAGASLAAATQQALSAYLALADEARERLPALSGRIVELQVRGLDLTLYFLPDDERIVVQAECDAPADTVLRATPIGLVKLGLATRASDVMLSGGVDIEGDVELGQNFKQILAASQIDWEEHISRLAGDAAAHQLGRAARGFFDWAESTLGTLQRDAGEYLREESEHVPRQEEVAEFLAGVDTLRDDVERMQARVQRLRRSLDDAGQAGE